MPGRYAEVGDFMHLLRAISQIFAVLPGIRVKGIFKSSFVLIWGLLLIEIIPIANNIGRTLAGNLT